MSRIRYNPLRIINKKYKFFKLFSIEGLGLLLGIAGLPILIQLFFPFINVKYIGISYILLGIVLLVDKFFMEAET